MEILIKISQARDKIKSSDLKKAGRNNHSKYDYYTPEQVSQLINEACRDLKLINLFELKRNELGLEGFITVYDLESDEKIVFNMATDMPKMTATNAAQQLGGAVTYTERYLLMSIYDIKDNNLDFDTTTKSAAKNTQQKKQIERELKGSEVEAKWNGKIYKDSIVYIDDNPIKPPKEQIEKLKKHKKYKPENK